MKTRIGFVSNSSSSSFVILGNEIDMDSAMKYKALSGDIWIRGDREIYGEGEDFFRMTPEMKKAILTGKINVNKRMIFYIVYKILDDESTLTKDCAKFLPCNINTIEVSQHHTYDIKDFLKRYGENAGEDNDDED